MEHTSQFDWNGLAMALLDSPVVIFLLVLILVWQMKEPLLSLLASRNIEIRWGDNQIKLSELSNSLDQELDPLKAEIELLQERIREIEDAREVENHPYLSEPEDIRRDNARQAILAALANRKYRWRSIPGLVKAAKAPEDLVIDIIQNDDSIVLGFDKHGESLAKLKDR